MLSKDELRKKAKEIRNSLNNKEISGEIVENIRNTDVYQHATNVMLFYPLEHEIDLLPLLDDNKNFYLPRVEGEMLVVCPFKKGDELVKSKFNTLEPVSNPIPADFLNIVFVPALMVDKEFHRLGYGKGFYDRFLAKRALQAIRIVPIANALLVDCLPSDEFDEKVDAIVDEV